MRHLLIGLLFSVISMPLISQTLVPANLITTNDTGFCPPATFDLQGIGGGACDYSVESIPYNTETVGGTSVTLFDDQIQGPYPIGFSFDFYCNTYTQFYICSNGWVGFTGGQTQTWVVNPVPSAAFNVPKNTIMAPWRDWNPGTGGGGPYVTYQTQGVAPNRKLVVTWSAVPMFSCTTTFGTFQVVLFESSNVIENNLTNVTVCPQWGGGDGVQAIHNLPGNNATIVLGRNDNSFTATNESWRYSSATLQWIYQGDTVGEGPTLEVSPANGVYPTQCEYVYAVLDSNNGNIAIDSVLVSPFCQVPVFQDTPVLCNGDSTGSLTAIDTNTASSLPNIFYWKDSSGDTIQTNIVNSNTNTLNNLPAGSYSVTIIDASGCYITNGTANVTEPPVLTASTSNLGAVSCPGIFSCDAEGTGNGNGGVAPYYYLWSTGEPLQTATQLCPDSNWVTVTDNNGCEATALAIIAVPDSIKTQAFNDTMICITNPASLVAASTGGTPPFNYVWTEESLTGTVISTSQAFNVFPDTTTQYFVYSVDDNGCAGDTSEVLITVRPPLFSEIPVVDTICPYDTITIPITGFGGDSAYTFSWSSGNFGPSTTVSPDEPVWYYVTVSDFCGTPPYLDSVFVQVGGYSQIDAEIRVEDDSICIGENVYLISSGRGGFRGPDEYVYEWSEASMDDEPIQFVRPTTTKTYKVTISDLCLSPEAVATKTVYVGEPYTPNFEANPAISCSGTDVEIFFDKVLPGHTYTWDFGDGSLSQNINIDTVNHQYKNPGCYDVTLWTVTDFGCISSRTKNCLVQILEAPTANYNNSPGNPNTLNPIVKFQDASLNAQNIIWYLDGDTLSESQLFAYEFIDTGLYDVSIVAISEDGCLDTLTKTLRHSLAETMYIPTSFSPNGDGLNDVFKIGGEGIRLESFEMSIFDRWGRELFLSTNPDYGWNGKYLTTGEYVPSGSYPYIINYKDKYGEPRTVRGQVVISSTGINRGLR